VDTELAGEAYQRYLEKEAEAATIAVLSESQPQNSHIDDLPKVGGESK
jgi:hypothetical protein